MLVGDMADLLQKYYSQVKNPNPVFTPREGAGTLKFCEKLMEKAVGFTSRFDFAIHVAHARSKGLRRRMPPVLRRRAIDALLQGLCFHYDPLANRVQCSITTLAIEVRTGDGVCCRKTLHHPGLPSLDVPCRAGTDYLPDGI